VIGPGPEAELVTDRLRVGEIDEDEDRRPVRIVRRGARANAGAAHYQRADRPGQSHWPYALRRSRSAVDPMADPHSVPSEGGETGVNVGKCGETPTAEAQDEGGNSIVSAVARHLDTVAVGRNGAFGNGALGIVGS